MPMELFMHMVPPCCVQASDHPADRAELCAKSPILEVVCHKLLRQGRMTDSGVPRTTVTLTTQTVCFVKDLLVMG